MSRQMTALQLNKAAKSILLESENGEENYKKLCEYSEFLKGIRDFEGERFKLSKVGSLISDKEYKELSILVRKLKTPFMTGVPHFDDQTAVNANQKRERVLAVIPQDVMSQLTELDTPFVYELPTKPVVSVPELQPVSEDTIRSELGKLSASILSALFALFTEIGVTPIRTECDNDPQKRSWIQDTIKQIGAGEIPTTQNQETHRAFHNCCNSNWCHFCRPICAILSILRFGGNPEIDKQVCRSVWYGSPFAEQAMRRLLILRLGPTCALAQVVCNPESPHRAMLVQILTELNVQETPQEKRLRQQEDDADKKLKRDQFELHEFAEQVLAIAGMKTSVAFDRRGYNSAALFERDM